MKDFLYFSAEKLSQLIGRRELSVSELVKALIHRIESLKSLNALVQSNFERAREAAHLADEQLKQAHFTPPILFGVPFTVKDVYAIPDMLVTYGTEGLANKVCKENTTAINRLLQQGAIFLGLSNTPEMGVSNTASVTVTECPVVTLPCGIWCANNYQTLGR